MIDTGTRHALIGIGGCGRNILKAWQARLPEQEFCMAVDRDKRSFVMREQLRCFPVWLPAILPQ